MDLIKILKIRKKIKIDTQIHTLLFPIPYFKFSFSKFASDLLTSQTKIHKKSETQTHFFWIDVSVLNNIIFVYFIS